MLLVLQEPRFPGESPALHANCIDGCQDYQRIAGVERKMINLAAPGTPCELAAKG